MLVPGRYKEPQGSGRKLYGGDRVGWGVCEFELCCELSIRMSRSIAGSWHLRVDISMGVLGRCWEDTRLCQGKELCGHGFL